MVSWLFNVNNPIPMIAKKALRKTLFSGAFFRNSAENRGTNITVKLTRKPALEVDVVFTPKVIEAKTKNKIKPKINAYLIVLKSVFVNRLEKTIPAKMKAILNRKAIKLNTGME
jgi:hypothetical protein